jgi:hypothetical protein
MIIQCLLFLSEINIFYCLLLLLNVGIKKRRISRWFRIRWKRFKKMHTKKLLANIWRKNALFWLLLIIVKLVLLITFFCTFFTTFSTDSKSAWNSAFFDIFYDLEKNWGHISTFWKLWSQIRKKRLKKSKNIVCKCVLDFNFAAIKGPVFFIFFKNVKFVVP